MPLGAVCDRGTPRSWASKRMYAYLSRDSIDPADFRQIGRRELARYPGVELRDVEVTRAKRVAPGFEISLASGAAVACRKLLIATGMMDILPAIPGFEQFFGRTIFQCPYCDGWEMRGKALAVYGRRRRGFEMARALTAWTDDIVLCTDGRAACTSAERAPARAQWHSPGGKAYRSSRGPRGKLQQYDFATANAWRVMECFSTRPLAASRSSPIRWDAVTAATAAFFAGSTRRPAFPGCSWQETSSAMCSYLSSRPPRAHAPHSGSIAR